ncbi:hypothetical protein XENORESO_009035 [Xenotaenia resolanae]|uniref:Uncharacterized protein n=1 Tax=Xenotaenia resolanae TaxID=208358 RepID=A0ABV0VZL4_9TELE
MVMYLATNLGHSPKAVRRAGSSKKHYSHLDIHKTSVPPAIACFIKIPLRREEEEILDKGQSGKTGRKKPRGQLVATARWGICGSSYYPCSVKIGVFSSS